MRKLWGKIRRFWSGTTVDPEKARDGVWDVRAANLEAEANRVRQFPGGV